MRAILLILLLAGCTTVHHNAPPAVPTPAVDNQVDKTSIVQGDLVDKAPVLQAVPANPWADSWWKDAKGNPCPLPPPYCHRPHKVNHAKAIVAAPAIEPADPVLQVVPKPDPVFVRRTPEPGISVGTIAGAFALGIILIFLFAMRKSRKPTMADGMDQMVNQMRRGFQKTKDRL
jgi:hypothetical protein